MSNFLSLSYALDDGRTAIALCAHTNVWQRYGRAVKGERYAFKATSERARNIVREGQSSRGARYGCSQHSSAAVLSHCKGDTSEPVVEHAIGDALRLAAQKWGGRIALVDGSPTANPRRRWTFEQLLEDAEQVARALLGRFTPGDHVAIWSPNCPEWVLLEFGAALAGITLVTANPAYLAKELVHVLKQSKAHGIVICPEYRGRDFRAVLRQIAADVPNLREVIGLSDWSDFLKSGETSRAALLPPTIEPELSSRI